MTTAALTAVNTAIANLQTALDNAGPLNGLSLAALAPVIAAARAAKGAIDAAVVAGDALIYASPAYGVAGVVGGGFAPTLALTLQAQLAAMQNQVVLIQMRGYVGRILFNLANTTG